jgi:CHAD domain-containing protein
MPPFQQTENLAAPRPERAAQPRRPHLRLNPMMACDTAFRVVAGRCLGSLIAHHEATCGGDPTALHQMRVALTRLRTAILLFSPMVAGTERTHLRHELKWLNGRLGIVRDLDVALERLKSFDKRRSETRPLYRAWRANRADSQRRLARVLQSPRYTRLIKATSDWIENGPWSIRKGKRAMRQRACPVAEYSAGKLTRWRKKLLKKGRKIRKMGAGKRHRLRLLNKKLSYSIEFMDDLASDKRFSSQQATLKYLRQAHRSLGDLNDDANGQSLIARLRRDGIPSSLKPLGPKQKKRLVRSAAKAYRKLADVKAFGD